MNEDKYNWYFTSQFTHVEPPNIEFQRRLYSPIHHRSMKILANSRRKTMERQARTRAWQDNNRRHLKWTIKYKIKRKLGLI